MSNFLKRFQKTGKQFSSADITPKAPHSVAFLISSVCIILVEFTTKILSVDTTNAELPEIPYAGKYSYVTPVGLKSLFALERTLYENLSQYASKSSSLSQKLLEPYLGDYAESMLKVLNSTGKKDEASAENPSGNPILAFRTVWRFVRYLRRWAQPLTNMPKNQASQFKDISLLIAQHYNASHGPTIGDLDDAKMALIKLVDIFTIDIQQFAAGNISGKDVGIGLTAAQCIQIGRFAISQKFYMTGVEFMEAALDKVEQTGDVTVQLSKALEQVKSAYLKHDTAFENEPKWESDFFTKPVLNASARSERIRRREAVSMSQEMEMYAERRNHKYRYQRLCSGTIRQANKVTSKLFCWYEHQVDPTFKIGPLKAEFVAPQTVKFHQLIPETAISQLKKNMTTFREVRVIQEGKATKNLKARLAAFVELLPSQSSTARLIADLVERTTGFQYNENNILETLQMTVYSPGAYYFCHPDLIPLEESYHLRMATFMVYLSDVQKGGGTGFCERGYVVQPEVGSAILWYNMLSSGKMDYSSNHCSCPVVFGEKWVASAWIYMGPQSHLQCDKDPSKKLEYLVNKRSAGIFS